VAGCMYIHTLYGRRALIILMITQGSTRVSGEHGTVNCSFCSCSYELFNLVLNSSAATFEAER
jgi:hypothetical protein